MKKDARINAKSISFKNYAVIFIVMLFFCGSYAGIYFMQIEESALYYIIASMFTYIVVVSIAVCVLFALFRKRILMRPVYQICDAAQKVAQGDFSVRIPPMRKDGKKDEFEVLFEDFNTMAAELASIEMLKSDFVSNVSHELKTPLAVIQNYATILQSEDLSLDEYREYSLRIGVAAERLSVLVSNILQVNRLENQKIKPSLQPFNVSEALCRCILNYDTLLEEKEIELSTKLDQNLVLNSDESMLDMVWNNLLSNAIKFTPQGGHIRVELEQNGEYMQVLVADDGCGIPPEAVRHIFDKFYQADTSHAMQGNGLGLALANRIVTILDGEILVKSVLGQGSAFTVRIKME